MRHTQCGTKLRFGQCVVTLDGGELPLNLGGVGCGEGGIRYEDRGRGFVSADDEAGYNVAVGVRRIGDLVDYSL